jgi:phosphatidylglycerophosphatase A
MIHLLARVLCSWFGSGYLPWMPGTWGSIAAFGCAVTLLNAFGQIPTVSLTIGLSLIGWWATQVCFEKHRDSAQITNAQGASGDEGAQTPPTPQTPVSVDLSPSSKPNHHDKAWDPSWIVIDEVAGYFCALILVSWFQPLSLLNLLVALIFFRLFDIMKPFPISWVERKLGQRDSTAALGVMLDDIVAGILAGIFTMIAMPA